MAPPIHARAALRWDGKRRVNGWRPIVASRWFRLALSSALLVLLLRTTNLDDMRAARARLSWLALALGACLISQTVSAGGSSIARRRTASGRAQQGGYRPCARDLSR